MAASHDTFTKNNTHNTWRVQFWKCGPCPVFASYTLTFALQLREKHGKTSVRVAQYKKNEHAQRTNTIQEQYKSNNKHRTRTEAPYKNMNHHNTRTMNKLNAQTQYKNNTRTTTSTAKGTKHHHNTRTINKHQNHEIQ